MKVGNQWPVGLGPSAMIVIDMIRYAYHMFIKFDCHDDDCRRIVVYCIT